MLSLGFLVFNMLAIQGFKQEVFFDREKLAGVELVMLIGFGLVVLFVIVSLAWIWSRLRQAQTATIGDGATLVLGILCLFLLIGEKVMIDEIGREYRLGWEVMGEWIILYALLGTQLLYNLAIVVQLYRARREQRALGRR
jgi:hypothetical protein